MLPTYVADASAIQAAIASLFTEFMILKLRLLGVRASRFKPKTAPLKEQLKKHWGAVAAAGTLAQPSAGATRSTAEADRPPPDPGSFEPVPSLTRQEQSGQASATAMHGGASEGYQPSLALDCQAAIDCGARSSDAGPAAAQTLPTSPSSKGGPNDGLEACAECGLRFLAPNHAQEHRDWHMARSVNALVNGPGYLEPRRGADRGRQRERHGVERNEVGSKTLKRRASERASEGADDARKVVAAALTKFYVKK